MQPQPIATAVAEQPRPYDFPVSRRRQASETVLRTRIFATATSCNLLARVMSPLKTSLAVVKSPIAYSPSTYRQALGNRSQLVVPCASAAATRAEPEYSHPLCRSPRARTSMLRLAWLNVAPRQTVLVELSEVRIPSDLGRDAPRQPNETPDQREMLISAWNQLTASSGVPTMPDSAHG